MSGRTKMGRPTTNPKSNPIHARLDAESAEILELYCKQEGVSKMEAVRRGIKRLRGDLTLSPEKFSEKPY